MKPLTLADIASAEQFAKERDALRKRLIALKKIRRVDVGPRIAIVFENRETMRFQIQEMCRIEHITDPRLIQQEIDIYNELLPLGHAIGATLLIALTQEDDIAQVLQQLSGVEEHVFLVGEGFRVHAQAEAGRSTEEKTSAVHYLTFNFTLDQINALALSPRVSLAIHHAGYDFQTVLEDMTKASLLADLIH
ncbi:MAG: DUF3501 domain-containing protein [Sulfobacillus thermosulfidooxidans]|uniref:DUF3501 family protein n=1 Tax=Sulfobacillus thermotolerans TaxID=338644 RepID=A0ABM6RRE8_9FIRM|nr:DUF3501 family protein [Sulfobacillus sp. hq2]AUW93988.1 hypothetical protein BXT84_08530 [Sulfobacillus thermotolerans]MCY0907615.1 DUF3501 family protein [Sulfobacillus thermotolerans]POB11908.1 hypothetical protein CO251_02035 [Sulfobacillus sp. hq2]PSR37098.1 MAG: DUF3501 domain-containing protein [Sulfobacillus thermosulfidooxidans]